MRYNAVYTAIFGKYGTLTPLEVVDPASDYICFTSERLQKVAPWKIINVGREFRDDSKNSRLYKILPHLFLQEYSSSLWVDANINVMFDLNKMGFENSYFTMFQHPENIIGYRAEGRRCIGKNKDTREKIQHQMNFYDTLGGRSKSALPMCGIIHRKHNDYRVKQLCHEWFSHIAAFSRRDQISIGYLMENEGFANTVNLLKYKPGYFKIGAHKLR